MLEFSVFSIMYMIQSCPSQYLVAYGIYWQDNYFGCKFQNFILYLPPIVAGLMLFLASFDRFCSSSNLVRLCSISEGKKQDSLFALVQFQCAFI